jgi:DNA-3-methyladenine glycosylase II
MKLMNNPPADQTVLVEVVEPYDFGLSWRSVRAFQPAALESADRLSIATRVDGAPVLIEVGPGAATGRRLQAASKPEIQERRLTQIVEWVLFAELDLKPFYSLTANDPRLSAVTHGLSGLKPMRPASLFEMAIIAITEQQISLAAAYQIRLRLIQRYGEALDKHWIFPEPRVLASAPLEDFRSLGLSRQKAQYIQDLSNNVATGRLDLDSLKSLDDEEARQTIMSWRGFGRWSADYMLIRGLARPDCVPIDDLAIRSVVGRYLGDGQRVTAAEAARQLESFRPYRGLAAFYLLAAHRLNFTARP